MARLIIHPGEHLADEPKALGMSANELAKESGIRRTGSPRLFMASVESRVIWLLRLGHFFRTIA
jgi:hypothetical protein